MFVRFYKENLGIWNVRDNNYMETTLESAYYKFIKTSLKGD